MNRLLRTLFFLLLVRPLVLLVLGMKVRNRAGLQQYAQAIVVANHNSHLDTLVLLSLFPLRRLNKVRPVAAEDYFLKKKGLAWFALNIMGIIPLNRGERGAKEDPLAGCAQALDNGETLIIFPEGSRGEPDVLARFKTGVAHLAKRYPEIPVVPVFMCGLGKALPRGECVLVPVICDVLIGEAIHWPGGRQEFMLDLELRMKNLGALIKATPWS